MSLSYLTLMKKGESEIMIQRSRFLGSAIPCASEEEALAHLKSIRETYRDARHHCYAYIIGENAGIMRYSDDGEPGGTAGLPMISLLKNRGLVNCCVVVTRYFGGILLGTGGLVRAYTQTTQAAVEAACPGMMELTSSILCEVPYPVWDSVRYIAAKLPVRIENLAYGTAVSFHLLVRAKDEQEALDALEKASGRQLETLPEEQTFHLWEIDPISPPQEE